MNGKRRLFRLPLLASLAFAFCANSSGDQRPSIEIGSRRTFNAAQLLSRSETKTITVPYDASYQRSMTYRAIPLRALLAGSGLGQADVIQLVGADGFKTNLPMRFVTGAGDTRAVPWLAIEPPGHPWPRTSGGLATGPFYLVWVNPDASGILREQWPFAVVSINLAEPVTTRWPWLRLGPTIAAGSPIRRGQEVASSECMACHKIYDAGDADIGPDLGKSPGLVKAFSPAAFRAFVRRPPPSGRMPAFGPEVLSDTDIDALYGWFGYLEQRGRLRP